MAKTVFAHDHIFYRDGDTFYSTGGLSKEVLERYTEVFGHVSVISRQRAIEGKKLTAANAENVNFIPIPDFKSIKKCYRIIGAKSIIEKEVSGSDLVIARLPSSIGNIAVKYAKKHEIPYLIEIVACPWDALWNHSITGKIVAPLSFFKLKKTAKNAPFVLYVTNEFLQKRYPTDGKSVNCSNVALVEFDDRVLEQRLKIIESMGKKVVLGTAAAVDVRHKGQQYIIKALGKLKREGIENFEYQLVGDGDRAYLESIAEKNDLSDRVRFLGTMPHSKVFEWLDTIDLYVQPSRQEGLPRALIEAMSRGVPSFGARTAGIPELIDDKHIFSNTKSNIKEICDILASFDKESMKEQAVRNYNQAKQYDKDIIEGRRKSFFIEFKNSTK